jgi:ankyrin repeat protein
MKNYREALNKLDDSGKSSLHHAAERADLPEVKRLLDAGASINLKTLPMDLVRSTTALGLVLDRLSRQGISREDVIKFESIKSLLIDYGADRSMIADVMQREMLIAAIKDRFGITDDLIAKNQKAVINQRIVQECSEGREQLTEIYTNFYSFLQNRFVSTINALKVVASEIVVPESNDFPLINSKILELIPYMQQIMGIYKFFSKKAYIENFKHCSNHFINNTHIDQVAEDFCARMVKYYRAEVLQQDEDIGPIMQAVGVINSVMEEAKTIALGALSSVIGVSVEEIVQQNALQGQGNLNPHWEGLAQKCISKFMEYIRDHKVSHDGNLGVKAAEAALPHWPQKLSIDTAAKKFDLGNAYGFSSLAYLAYETKAKIEEIAKGWGIKTEDYYIKQTNYLKSFVMYDGEKIVISFRGTYHNDVNWHRDDFYSIPTNMDVRGKTLPVHTGFYNAMMSHWDKAADGEKPLKEVVAGYLVQNQKAKICITGHSLGAAMASLCYFQVLNLSQELSPNQIMLYTFGQPAWGKSPELAKEMFDSNYYRIMNYLDPVPNLPEWVGYKHLGPLYYIHKDGRLLDEENYGLLYHQLNASGYREINDGNILAQLVFVEQHYMKNYFSKIKVLASSAQQQQSLTADVVALSSKHKVKKSPEVNEERYLPDEAIARPTEKIFSSKTQKLVKKGGSNKNKKDGNSLLHLAAAEGDLDLLKELLEKDKGCVNKQNKSGYSPLKLAIDNDNVKAAAMLIKEGADINVVSWLNNQPLLCWAAQRGHKEIISLIFDRENGVNINIKDQNGFTPFYLAAKFGYASIVKLFLSKETIKASLNLEDKFEWRVTALWKAVKEGHLETAELLLDNGADIKTTDGLSKLPLLELAARQGNLAMMKLLILKGAEYEPKEYCQMDDEDNSLLHLCAKHADLEDLYLRIADRFKGLVGRNKSEKTVEDLAKENDRLEILEKMWQGKSLYDDQGYHCLAKGYKTKTLSKIYKYINWEISIEEARKGININKVNDKGNTVLYELTAKICYTAEDSIIKLGYIQNVLAFGCDINLTARVNGFTPLHFAVCSNQPGLVGLLLNNGADLFKCDAHGRLPLSISLEYRYKDINNALASRIIEDKDRSMVSLIEYYKTGEGEVEIARFLHKKDQMLINTVVKDERTLLHLAVLYNKDDLALRIANLGSHLLQKSDKEGKTPLDYAKARGSPITEKLAFYLNTQPIGKLETTENASLSSTPKQQVLSEYKGSKVFNETQLDPHEMARMSLLKCEEGIQQKSFAAIEETNLEIRKIGDKEIQWRNISGDKNTPIENEIIKELKDLTDDLGIKVEPLRMENNPPGQEKISNLQSYLDECVSGKLVIIEGKISLQKGKDNKILWHNILNTKNTTGENVILEQLATLAPNYGMELVENDAPNLAGEVTQFSNDFPQ